MTKELKNVLYFIRMLDDKERAIIVEVLHNKYGLTYIESEEEKQNEKN